MSPVAKERPCSFCSIHAEKLASLTWYDTPLLQTEHFFVVPSIGAMVPGWVMVLPKVHALSIARVPHEQREELKLLINRTRTVVEKRFGPATLFEHGASAAGSLTGCGVDHAHLHIVPLHFSLISLALNDEAASWVRKTHGPHGIKDAQSDYLLISEDSSTCVVGHLRQPQSQYFRRLIANAVGTPGQYNYRTYLFLNNVRQTVEGISEAVRSLEPTYRRLFATA
jgi:diadenosine tetraphosphate (Ap4A) HIT family hydrolase